LYVIELNKHNKELVKENKELQLRLERLEKIIFKK